jgi:hypothetical protein
MLSVLRAELLDHLLRLGGVLDRYATGDPDFVGQATRWLSGVEETLKRFRQPAASLMAAQHGLILAAGDGFRDPQIDPAVTSPRKLVRATASLCLSRAESSLRSQVAAIDEQLEPVRLKMAQLVSVASSVKPIPLPPTEPHTIWLQNVWNGLVVNGDTKPMHAYISSVLSPVDRLYLLDELLSNLLAKGTGNAPQHPATTRSRTTKKKKG